MTAAGVDRSSSASDTGIAAVWRVPAARQLQLADMVSGTGDALYWVALVVVLMRADSSGTLLATAVVARLAPRVLLGPVAGVVADRYDRARLMVTLDLSRAALMAVLATLVALDAPPASLVVVVFLVGAFGTPYRPAAIAKMAGSVGERLLAPATALTMSMAQLVGLTGPVLAAALLAVAAPPWAFAANAVTFTIAAFLVGRTRAVAPTAIRHAAPGRAGWTAALRSGATTVRCEDGLAVVLAMAATLAVVRGAELVLYVQVAERSLGLGDGGYGLIAGAVGAGALVAIPLSGRVGRAGAVASSLVTSAVVSAGALLALAGVDAVAPALVVVVVQGAATAVFEVVGLTTIQRLSPPASIGRVVGLHTTMTGGARLVGSLLAPLALATIGLRAGLVVFGAAALASVLGLGVSVRALGRRLRQRRAELAPMVERLGRLGIFAYASPPTRERLAMRVTVVSVRAGTVIIREGDEADDFYVVASGRLTVDTGGVEVNRLGPDDWCGEIGLLRQMPRVATVTAETDTVLWRIPGDELVTALTAGARLPDALVDDMEIRLARSEAVRA